MVTRARLAAVREQLEARTARSRGVPDEAELGALVDRDPHHKLFVRPSGDVEGSTVSTLLMRGPRGDVSGLRLVGVCMAAVTGGDCGQPFCGDCRPPAAPDEQPDPGNPWAPPDDEPPADGQPQPVPVAPRPPAAPAAAEHPEPAGTHPSGTATQPDHLAAIAAARWSKDPSGKGTAL